MSICCAPRLLGLVRLQFVVIIRNEDTAAADLNVGFDLRHRFRRIIRRIQCFDPFISSCIHRANVHLPVYECKRRAQGV